MFKTLFNCQDVEDLAGLFEIRRDHKVPAKGFAFASYPYHHHLLLNQLAAEQGKKLVVTAYLRDGNPDECVIITYKPAVMIDKPGAEVYANGHLVGWIAADLSGYMYTNYTAYNAKMMAVIFEVTYATYNKQAGERMQIFVKAEEVRHIYRTEEEIIEDLKKEQAEEKKKKEAQKMAESMIVSDADEELQKLFEGFTG